MNDDSKVSNIKYEIYIKPHDSKTAQLVTKEIYDLVIDLDLEINKLQTELKRERKCVDFYADKSNWYDADYSNSYTKINYDDYIIEDTGGKLARETQKLRSEK